jgi:hypothetical protein
MRQEEPPQLQVSAETRAEFAKQAAEKLQRGIEKKRAR